MQDYLPEEIKGGNNQYQGALVQVEQSRAVQEVQASMLLAKNFPRDEIASEARILKECERKSLAEISQYAYPRGTSQVSGPSVKLAEVIARNWGNLTYGLRELSQSNGTSEVEAYCHDLETNTKASRTFVVQHIRQKRSGNVELTDPRDVYEMVANQGQRRVRAVILEIVPADIVEKAVEQCNKTLTSAYTEPLEDRIANMIRAFDKLGVPQSAIERRLNHVASVITEMEITGLKKIYQSIKDGMSDRDQWFDLSSGKAETLRERISKSQEKRIETQEEPEPEEKTFRSEYISKKEKGFKPWVIKNQARILAYPEEWEEIRIKWLKFYGEEPFPFRLRRGMDEPTENNLKEEPEPPQEISNPKDEIDFSDHKAFIEAMSELIEKDRQTYYDIKRELKINDLVSLKEADRKDLYYKVKSAMSGPDD